ncbi:cellulose-growth-specific protein [Crepidotus variabilis]|uniref:AA9 family lytic polysaccharide monooxygenase n=1 Tax=Crepidotus variabilis TaxID=179855 RepID=A0A9P6EHR2_9AGAR|nr:cellulose-growth-specific protein [Crepidotus variabilis]
MLRLVVLGLTIFVQRVIGHGGVIGYKNAGVYYEGWKPYNPASGQSSIERPWSTYDPMTDVTASTFSCNNDGTAPAGQKTAQMAAGSDVTLYWNDNYGHDTGPILTYLAQCPGSCTGGNTKDLQWFKIQEAGLLSGTIAKGSWAAGKMIANNHSWTTTIPNTVPAGQYMIRHETIALHSLPSQSYAECAQIEITGGGTRAPLSGELVKFPGGYSKTDPGINCDLYGEAAKTATTYVIPGPPLYGSGSGSPVTPGPGTTDVPTASPVPTTSPPAPTAPGTVAHYGQCGGLNYSGPTGCIAPYTCQAQNQYYSQCI